MQIRLNDDSMGQIDLNDMWNTLKNAIESVHNKRCAQLSYEQLYRYAYTMVLYGHGEKLYYGTSEIIKEHLENKVRENILMNLNNNFLEALCKNWSDHQISLGIIQDILMYMDRTYVLQHHVDNVYNMGIKLFLNHIERFSMIRTQIQQTLVSMVMMERNGKVIDGTLMRNASHMLLQLGINSRHVYEEDFEIPFLRNSSEFYKIKGQNMLLTCNTSEYIKQVEQRINEESERTKHFLDVITEQKIITLVENELIVNHMKSIVEMENCGLVYMLRHNCIEDMRLMYKVLGRVKDGLKVMISCISGFLREEGKSLVTQKEGSKVDAIEYIQSLLDLKNKFDSFLSNCFNNDKKFLMMVSRDFEYFINLNVKSPEYLCVYLDNKLKKGVKAIEEHDIDNDLEKCIVLFRYLNDKDIFEGFYRQFLAKRLLHNNSVSNDCEKNMVLKLRNQCGCQYSLKLEAMFRDMSTSNITMQDFWSHLNSSAVKLRIDLEVRVLTTGFWPTQLDISKCNLPEMLQIPFEAFRSFYLSKHAGRKLTLQPHIGFAELNAVFYGPKGTSSSTIPRTHILQVSTHQMCVLLLFNKREKLSFEEIENETEIAEQDLKRALKSLTMGKVNQRTLIKEPNCKEIEAKHMFTVNDCFNSKLHKVKIQCVTIKHDLEIERKQIQDKVDDDRKYEIEASIVRIMKSRHQLTHSLLVAEVTQQLQLRFTPCPSSIKKRIEALIERDYIQRNPQDRNIYLYNS